MYLPFIPLISRTVGTSVCRDSPTRHTPHHTHTPTHGFSSRRPDNNITHSIVHPKAARTMPSIAMLRLAAAGLLALTCTPSFTVRAQEEEDGEPELDDEVRPAPPSIGADVPLAYFGPPPSSVDRRLVGPFQLLTAGQIDEDAGTIQLPLYKGYYRACECPDPPSPCVCGCRRFSWMLTPGRAEQ